IVQGDDEWETVENYVAHLAPDLAPRLTHWVDNQDAFSAYRIDEQLVKALDRKVWLPSGGSLVIDRTEAMVVVDVNTGKFVGKGGNLEETVTKNNLEAAEEIVRQLRLRDLGGIIVVDFIDMVLESNRELVLRRLMECLGRDRTKHQVAEVTSLGLVQMTRKRVGQGLLESFSETCPECQGRGVIIHMDHGAPTVPDRGEDQGRRENGNGAAPGKSRTGKGGRDRGPRTGVAGITVATVPDEAPRAAAAAAIAKIAAASVAHSAAQLEPSSTEPPSVELLDEAPEVTADAAPPSRPSRRGRRGASAPAGSPTPVEAVQVAPEDVAAVEQPGPDSDAPAEIAPAAPRARRRRGGSAQVAGGDAPETAPAPAAEPLPVAAAVATATEAPSSGTAPRRRRAASRPAGPAAMSAPPA
ncbi:MAG: ribonuclease, partial [Frankiales bacterium]|nr:ribonuclease [Frankiales bacterium]